MSDDQQIIDALCSIDFPHEDVAYSSCLCDADARRVLAAIRAGEVPGIRALSPTDRAMCDEIATLRSQLAAVTAELDAIQSEASKCFDNQEEIDKAWNATGMHRNRGHLTLAEQISAIMSEDNEALEKETERLNAAQAKLADVTAERDALRTASDEHLAKIDMERDALQARVGELESKECSYNDGWNDALNSPKTFAPLREAQAEASRLRGEIMGVSEVGKMRDTLRLERIASLVALLKAVWRDDCGGICVDPSDDDWFKARDTAIDGEAS